MMTDDLNPLNHVRLLPAYRKHDDDSRMLSDAVPAAELEVEVAYSEDISSTSSSSLVSVTVVQTTHVVRLTWKQKLRALCRRIAAFLLSTVGLTMLTIAYAVAGGYLFSALESGNEQLVTTSVTESLQWHLDELWINTKQLNVLHPVRTGDLTVHLGLVIRDAHGYPDTRINPDNKLSGYIRIINYPFNYPSDGGSLFSCTFCAAFRNFYAILQKKIVH